MANSTRKRRSRKSANGKPPKPYADFPLTPHESGWWVKRAGGNYHYIAKWGERVNGKMRRIDGDGWEKALSIWNAQQGDLVAGRDLKRDDDGPDEPDGLRLADLCNQFLAAKLYKLQKGRLSARTFIELKATTDRLIAFFTNDRTVETLKPVDFTKLMRSFPENWGPYRIAGEVQRTKSIFIYGHKNELFQNSIRFGTEFVKPESSEFEEARNNAPRKEFSAEEIRSLIDAATPPMKAMILLGINVGFGNNDCSSLTLSSLDLDGGWVQFPRPKTKAMRKAKLWPETCAAVQAVIDSRPTPKDIADNDRVFLTRFGERWVRVRTEAKVDADDDELSKAKRVSIDSVQLEFRKLCKSIGLARWGRGFYSLRHTYRTRVDRTLDLAAIRITMGHKDPSIDARYIESIEPERLEALTTCVHAWLWPPKVEKGGANQEGGEA